MNWVECVEGEEAEAQDAGFSLQQEAGVSRQGTGGRTRYELPSIHCQNPTQRFHNCGLLITMAWVRGWFISENPLRSLGGRPLNYVDSLKVCRITYRSTGNLLNIHYWLGGTLGNIASFSEDSALWLHIYTFTHMCVVLLLVGPCAWVGVL